MAWNTKCTVLEGGGVGVDSRRDSQTSGHGYRHAVKGRVCEWVYGVTGIHKLGY
jgi:hypothetical protein